MPSTRIGAFAVFFVACLGCATERSSNTARTGTEQLLISNAVDQALDKVDFSTFTGSKIQLEEKYLDSVDKTYVIASIRHRLLYHGATLVTDVKEADIVLEVRSGALGTDGAEMFYGVPEIVLPGMMSIPELKVVTRSNQKGTAKIGLVAIDAKTHRVLGSGGVSIASSDATSWSVLGVGPYKSGTIRQELNAGASSDQHIRGSHLPYVVSFDEPSTRSEPRAFRLTNGSQPDAKQ